MTPVPSLRSWRTRGRSWLRGNGPVSSLDRAMLDARLNELRVIVEGATCEELPGLIGELEAAKATAWQRINAGPSVNNDVAAAVEPDDDSMLTKRDVLVLCGRADDKSESWVDQQVKAGRLQALREPGTVRGSVRLRGKGVRFRKSEVVRFRREEYEEVNV